MQVLATLRFSAKGGMLSETASCHGISKSSMSRTVDKVTKYLCSLSKDIIRYPDDWYKLMDDA